MKRILAILIFSMLSCAPRYQSMQALLGDPDNIIVPFDTTFLGYQPVMDLFNEEDLQLADTLDRIVFTGSSSIRKWETLKSDFDSIPAQVLNRGFGGSTLRQVNYFFDDVITPHQPELIVLYCGENDITDGYQARDVLEAFRTFLRLTLKNSPKSKVLYISMKPSPARWELWPEFEKGNRLIATFIKRLNNPDIRYFDIGNSMLSPKTKYPEGEIFVSDSLHMNALGYERWQAAILPEVTEMLYVP
ncbi:MAG: GDSL-type esterase/lipase family protein [Bacteroidota bacterium]